MKQKINFKEFKEAKNLVAHMCTMHGRNAVMAMEVARDLKVADAIGLEVQWELEEENWMDFVGDGVPESTYKRWFEEGSHEVYSARVELGGEVLASLGGIVMRVDDKPYKAAIDAELLGEAVAELEEVHEWELEARYDEVLDEVYGETNIGGYQYSTSRALKEVDPVAYREGFLCWLSDEVEEKQLFEVPYGTYYQRGN